MITLTRLNNQRFVLNAELIRTIEQNPDTIITLTSGDRMVVKEPMEQVVQKSVEYGRLLRRLMPVS
jgi:flagellar protein FlbD